MAEASDTLTVLLVDDDEVDRIAVRRLLQRGESGILVLESMDRETCLRQCAAQPVDCVLLDYHLPGDDGLQIIQALRDRAIDMPVIMLTGQDDEALAGRVLDAGASDYLEKDGLGATRLQSTVANVVNAKRQERRAQRFLNALRILSEGTAGAIGSEFFSALVHHLGLAFGAKHAWVACLNSSGDTAETLAYWAASGDSRHTWRYHLAGTACVEALMGDGLLLRADSAVELVDVEDESIVLTASGSYMAIPLRQENAKPLGLLVMVGAALATDHHGADMVLSIFAQRAVGELRRAATGSRAGGSAAADDYLRGYADFLTVLHRCGAEAACLRQALAALRAATDDDRLLYYQHESRDDGRLCFRLVAHDTDDAFQGLSFVNAEGVAYLPHFGRWLEHLEQGEPLHCVRDACPEGEARLLQAEGVIACTLVPAMANGQCRGFLRVDRLKETGTWTVEQVAHLLRAAEMLALTGTSSQQ